MVNYTEQILRWLEIILYERFGANFKIYMTCLNEINLILVGHDKSITFNKLLPVFHESRSHFPCGRWRPENEGYISILELDLPTPGISDIQGPLTTKTSNGFLVGYDILGLTYWMLSRLEEVGRTDLDEHQRFPASSSHAYKHGYLDRPIVDEWLYILGQVMQQCWPSLRLKAHQFKLNLSHDVDAPSQYGLLNKKQVIRSTARKIIMDRNFKEAARILYFNTKTKTKILSTDEYNTFDFIMAESEKRNIKSAFYFICGQTNAKFDGHYKLEHPAIRQLLLNINERGHEIGLHPSYETFLNEAKFIDEARKLQGLCAELGMANRIFGGRMHYLRWSQPQTMQYWENAGLRYDSTLGYADVPGFRCGTCFDFPAFDPLSRKSLNIRLRPLVLMDVSVISKKYLNLGTSKEALNFILALKLRCKMVAGQFNMLWHNSNLYSSPLRELYLRAITN